MSDKDSHKRFNVTIFCFQIVLNNKIAILLLSYLIIAIIGSKPFAHCIMSINEHIYKSNKKTQI